MYNIGSKADERMREGLKRMQPIIASAKDRDINETDTVTIIKDILEHVFGYDRYLEITSEYKIRSTFCDIAIKIDNVLKLLIEVKAIGVVLKEHHVKQAVNYAVHEGLEWVVLTSGVQWELYKVVFAKPVTFHQVISFDILALDAAQERSYQLLYAFAREGLMQGAFVALEEYRLVTSRYIISAVLLSVPVLYLMRLETAHIFQLLSLSQRKMDITEQELFHIVKNEIVTSEIIDSQEFKEAQSLLRKLHQDMMKKKLQNKAKEQKLAPPPPPQQDPGSHGENHAIKEMDLDNIA